MVAVLSKFWLFAHYLNMDELLKDIGNELKRLRKEAGITSYADFAWAHGLSKTQYGRLEHGANLTITSLYKVLAIHNVSVPEFLATLKKTSACLILSTIKKRSHSAPF